MTGEIAIACNPYQWLSHLYTDEVRKEYFVFGRDKLEPHVYGTSAAAFNRLQESGQNQV